MYDSEQSKVCLEKLTWESRDAALAAAAYSVWQYGEGLRPVPYQCRSCGKWHLARRRYDDD